MQTFASSFMTNLLAWFNPLQKKSSKFHESAALFDDKFFFKDQVLFVIAVDDNL